MKKTITVIAMLVLLSPVFAKDEGIRLAIYNRGIVQVSDNKIMELKRGIYNLVFDDLLPEIKPETAFLNLSKGVIVNVLSSEFFDTPVDMDKLWARFLGRQIDVVSDDKPVSGLLINLDKSDLYVQQDDGTIKVVSRSSLEAMDFPVLESGFAPKPTLRYLINNDGKAGKVPIELNYLSSGMSWSAYYTVFYAKGKAMLSGEFMVVNDLPKGFDGVELTLVAGDPHMAKDKEQLPRNMDMAEAKPSTGIDGEPLLAYYRFPLESKVDIPRNATKRIPFISAKEFDAVEKYIMDSGFGTRNLETMIAFNNTDKPLPGGKIGVYRLDKDEQAYLIGEDELLNTSTGAEVEIRIGQAFDLQGDRRRVTHSRENRDSTVDVIRVKLTNSSGEDANVVVRERLFGVWSIESATFNGSQVEYKQIDSRRVEFNVKLNKQTTSNLEYKVRYDF